MGKDNNEIRPLLNVNDETSPNKAPNAFSQLGVAFLKHKSILFWSIGTIISTVLQGVYLKLAGNALASFPYFIFWSTAVPFMLLFFAYYFFVLFFTKQITPEMRKAKSLQYKMAIIGILTMVNGVAILFANPWVPGVMQALLGPTIMTIPIAMIFSAIMLKRRYNFFQIFAVFIILGGLAIALWPTFTTSSQGTALPPGCDDGDDSISKSKAIFWSLIFLSGSIPAAVMSVYEEKAFHDQPVHISYMLAYSTLWQTVAIFVSFPIDAIPGFGSSSSFSDLFNNQWLALQCTAGVNINANYDTMITCQNVTMPNPALVCPECDCDHAGLYLGLFVVFYVLSSFFLLGLVKYGNAAFSTIVSTLSTPASEFAFAIPFLMGSQVESISPYNYWSLGVLLIGVIMYRAFDHKVAHAESSMDVLERSDVNSNVNILRVSTFRSYATAQPHLFVENRKIADEQHERPSQAATYWTLP